MKKVLGLVIIISLIVVCFSGCSKSDKNESGENIEAAADAPVIALTMPSLTDLWWISIQKGVKARCEEIGAVYMENDAKNDVAKQMQAIETYIVQGVDGLIIGCVEPAAIETVVADARRAGIPVVTVATPLASNNTNVTISEREMGVSCGEMAAEFIKEQYGNEKVEVAILDNPKLPTVIERADSMVEILNKEVPNAEIVARQTAYDVATGLEMGEAILQAHPNVKIVLGINDGGVLGFSKAMVAAGITGDDVGGFGISTADEYMIEMAKPGSILRGTLDLYPHNIGAIAVDSCIKINKGEELPKVQNNPLIKVWQKDAAAWIEKNGLDADK